MLSSPHQGRQLGLFFFPLPFKSTAQRFERATPSFFLSCSLLVSPPTHPPTPLQAINQPKKPSEATSKSMLGSVSTLCAVGG